MHEMNIKRPDLNLLVVFAAVAKTGSVTKAAESLALSQPAVSHALRRLQDVVGTPLFVRSRTGLAATPKAKRMVGPVSAILDAASKVFREDPFDPATAAIEFRVGVSDYAALTAAPRLAKTFHKQAPRAQLILAHIDDRTLQRLEDGELDCAFWGASLPGAPYQAQTLYRERFVGVVGSNHPLAREKLAKTVTLKDYLAFPHAKVAFRDAPISPIDEALAAAGHKRHIAVSTPGFSSVLALLPGSQLIASAPSRLVQTISRKTFRTFDLPFRVPDIRYSLIWHRHKTNDQASAWLRALIAEAVEADS